MGVPCEILLVCIGKNPAQVMAGMVLGILSPGYDKACGARAELIFLETVKRHQNI